MKVSINKPYTGARMNIQRHATIDNFSTGRDRKKAL
jgi:hypothetical protein